MIVRHILDGKTKDISRLTISPDAFASTVARLITSENVGAVVAVDPGGRVVGIVSERDIVRSLAQQGQAISCLRVTEVMTTEVLVCHQDDSVDRVIKSMTERKVRHIPVVDETHRMIGLVTISDIVRSVLFDDLPPDTKSLCEYNRHRLI